MSWLRCSTGKLGVGLGLCAAFGCGDHATALEPSHGHVSSAPPERDRADDAGAALGSDSATGALSVTLAASPATVCPGACSELSAEIQGGQPPYRLRWDHGSPRQVFSQRVCPSSTTTYQLDVEDTGLDALEFSIPSAHVSASTTVVVRSDCGSPVADAGTPGEDLPSFPACSLRIPIYARDGENPWAHGEADADAAGNLYLAFELVGSTQLGIGAAPMSSSLGVPRVLVAKYDADCAFLWARWLGQPYETDSLGSIDVDDAGRLAVTMSYYVNVPGQIPKHHSRLVRLTTDGDVAWTLHSEGGVLTQSAGGHGLAWGADGALALMGLNDLCAAEGIDNFGHCVAKVTKGGEPAFARGIEGASGVGVFLDAAGNLFAGGLSQYSGVRVPGLPLPDGEGPFAFVTKFDATGEPQWLVTSPLERKTMNWTQGFVNVAKDGAILSAWAEVGGEVTTRFVKALRVIPSGALQSLSTLVVAMDYGASGSAYAGNAEGDLITAGSVLSVPVSSGNYPSTTFVTHFRADNSVASKREWTESLPVSPMRVRPAPNRQLILSSLEAGPSDHNGQTALVVRRLD